MSLFIWRFFLFFSLSILGSFTFAQEPVSDSTEIDFETQKISEVSGELELEQVVATEGLEESSEEESENSSSVSNEVNEADEINFDESLETVDEPEAIVKSNKEDQEMLLQIKSLIPKYKYNPSDQGDQDPFTPPTQLEGIATSEKDILHPVEKDSFDNIQLRAIIWARNEDAVPRALFETTDQKTYTLTKNDRLGKERALIFKIETNRVWVMKPFIDPGTGAIGYQPKEKTLDDKKQKDGSLYYEK